MNDISSQVNLYEFNLNTKDLRIKYLLRAFKSGGKLPAVNNLEILCLAQPWLF